LAASSRSASDLLGLALLGRDLDMDRLATIEGGEHVAQRPTDDLALGHIEPTHQGAQPCPVTWGGSKGDVAAGHVLPSSSMRNAHAWQDTSSMQAKS